MDNPDFRGNAPESLFIGACTMTENCMQVLQQQQQQAAAAVATVMAVWDHSALVSLHYGFQVCPW